MFRSAMLISMAKNSSCFIGFFSVFSAFMCTSIPVYGESHDLYSATTILAGDASYTDTTVNVNNSLLLTIQKDALLSGTINVSNNYELQIQNAGAFNATVNPGARVTQIIESDDEITTLAGFDL